MTMIQNDSKNDDDNKNNNKINLEFHNSVP